jgi:FkbM family methyltransferase
MYCIRENGQKTGAPFFVELKNDSSREKGNIMFFPGSGGAHYFHNVGFPERTNIYWVHDCFLDPKKDFLDIGAHIGSYTIPCATKANHTYAFECTPKTFCYLAANVALHRLEDKVSPLPFALGEKNGEAEIVIRTEDGGGNGMYVYDEESKGEVVRPRVKIQVRTLDSFEFNNIGFIKMDVEGMEVEVLKGARETLVRNGFPKIMFECWSWPGFEPKRKALFELFSEIGYDRVVKISSAEDMWLAEKS